MPVLQYFGFSFVFPSSICLKVMAGPTPSRTLAPAKIARILAPAKITKTLAPAKITGTPPGAMMILPMLMRETERDRERGDWPTD